MKQERLNSLAVLSFNKDVISDMHDFNQRVIENFASKKLRHAEYVQAVEHRRHHHVSLHLSS